MGLRNIIILVFLLSITNAFSNINHHSHDHETNIESHLVDDFSLMYSGGLSGGSTEFSIFSLFSSINKDLRRANITNLHQGKKELILTIDDGPTAGVTDKILDVLKRYDIQATFFILGSKVKGNKEILERMVKEGHIVANHSMEHKDIGEIRGIFKSRRIREAIVDAHKAMEKYMVNSPKWYFRAPYGSWQSRAAKIINDTPYGRNYYGPLLWDIGGELDAGVFKVRRAADWGCWNKGWSVKKCLKGYINETDEKRGGVVLFHDLHKNSAQLIERYIKHYLAKGDYRFISLDDLDIR